MSNELSGETPFPGFFWYFYDFFGCYTCSIAELPFIPVSTSFRCAFFLSDFKSCCNSNLCGYRHGTLKPGFPDWLWTFLFTAIMQISRQNSVWYEKRYYQPKVCMHHFVTVLAMSYPFAAVTYSPSWDFTVLSEGILKPELWDLLRTFPTEYRLWNVSRDGSKVVHKVTTVCSMLLLHL